MRYEATITIEPTINKARWEQFIAISMNWGFSARGKYSCIATSSELNEIKERMVNLMSTLSKCQFTIKKYTLERLGKMFGKYLEIDEEGYHIKPTTTQVANNTKLRYGLRRKAFTRRFGLIGNVFHHFWWLVHNCVVHVLIGVLPFKPFFWFHDYTSNKLNEW